MATDEEVIDDELARALEAAERMAAGGEAGSTHGEADETISGEELAALEAAEAAAMAEAEAKAALEEAEAIAAAQEASAEATETETV